MICLAGDCHGSICFLYEQVAAFEEILHAKFEAVIQVGDIGVWPDPERLDRATRKHDGAGDFAELLSAKWHAPIPTWFVKGNHDDFQYLEGGSELIEGWHYMPNGTVARLSVNGADLVVAALGGCFGAADYLKRRRDSRKFSHYLKAEIEDLRTVGRADILVLHDAPFGVPLGRSGKSESEGLLELLDTLQPSLCFFGHHHTAWQGTLQGVASYALSLIGRTGSLAAVILNESAAPEVFRVWPEG